MPSPGTPPSTCLPTQKLTRPCTLGYGGFITQALCWLNHWPLSTNSTSSPYPFPRGEAEISNPLIPWLVPLVISHHLVVVWGLSKYHLINSIVIHSSGVERGLLRITKDTHFIVLISKSFRISVPGMGTKTICISYYKSPYHPFRSWNQPFFQRDLVLLGFGT